MVRAVVIGLWGGFSERGKVLGRVKDKNIKCSQLEKVWVVREGWIVWKNVFRCMEVMSLRYAVAWVVQGIIIIIIIIIIVIITVGGRWLCWIAFDMWCFHRDCICLCSWQICFKTKVMCCVLWIIVSQGSGYETEQSSKVITGGTTYVQLTMTVDNVLFFESDYMSEQLMWYFYLFVIWTKLKRCCGCGEWRVKDGNENLKQRNLSSFITTVCY